MLAVLLYIVVMYLLVGLVVSLAIPRHVVAEIVEFMFNITRDQPERRAEFEASMERGASNPLFGYFSGAVVWPLYPLLIYAARKHKRVTEEIRDVERRIKEVDRQLDEMERLHLEGSIFDGPPFEAKSSHPFNPDQE